MDQIPTKAVLIFFVLLPIDLILATHQIGRDGFSATLFRRHSSTISNHIYSIYNRSNRRLQYLQRRANLTNKQVIQTTSTEALFVDNAEFLVKFKLGSPPREVKTVLDTGSGLTWIQCAPCDSCQPQTDPIFNPLNSTSFKSVSCKSETCKIINGTGCDDNNECAYTAINQDGSETEGILATENLIYNDVIAPNIIFGCAHGSSSPFDKSVDGVLGLDMSQESFLMQYKSMTQGKFSYCLPSMNGGDVITRLNFGDKSVVLGNPTPIKVSSAGNGLYYLGLLDISVGAEKLNVPQGTFEIDAKNGSAGTIIDSSTVLSFLTQPGYDMVVSKLKKSVQLKPTSQPPNSSLTFCFEGSEDDLKQRKVPDLVFHFEGLDVTVPPSNSFVLTSTNTICLAILPSADMSVFGGLLQQNLNVAYDADQMQIHMAPSDCTQS